MARCPSIPISIPAPLVDYELDVLWPPVTAAAVGAATALNGYPKYGSGTAIPIFNAKVGAGVANMIVYNNVYCAQTNCDGAGAVSGYNTHGLFTNFAIPLTKDTVAATFAQPEQARVFRLQFAMAQRAAIHYSGNSGYILQATAAGAIPGWIGAVGSNGIGIVGDGAGGWQYVSKQGGAGFAEAVPLVWPSPVAQWCVVDYEILGATGASDAAFNLYLNGALALTRSWGVGSLLPDYTAVVNGAVFGYAWNTGEAALVGNLVLANLRFMAGRYRVSGAQI